MPAKRVVPIKKEVQSVRTPPLEKATKSIDQAVKSSASEDRSSPVIKISPEQTVVPKKEVLKPEKESPKPVPIEASPVPEKETLLKAEEKKEIDVKKEEQKEEEKGKGVEVKSGPCPEKQLELDSKHSHALILELQRIMIKVWQEFPDKPNSAEEKLVADKFRNEAGDALRNILGLNVTKRILNINSGLYVKLYFSARPDKGQLTSFTRKHNMRTFKCIDSEANVYAAQISSFDDYDRICSATEVSCGRVKVVVKPCYSFSSCPPNLKTIFRGTETKDRTDKKSRENDKITSTNKNATLKDAKKDTEAIKGNKPSVPQIKNVPKIEVTKEKITPAATKTVKSLEMAAKAKPETEKANIGNKAKNAIVMNKPKRPEIKSEPVRIKNKNQIANARASKVLAKKVVRKEIVNKKAVSKMIYHGQLAMIGEYDSLETEEIPEKDFAEEDEMDDKDILALMSEGIVLDECGSEEE